MIIPKKLRKYGVLLKQYGVGTCLFRFYYVLSGKLGILKLKFPPWRWEQKPLEYWGGKKFLDGVTDYKDFRNKVNRRFFFPPGKPPRVNSEWHKNAIEEADKILAGNIKYFFKTEYELGMPFDWFYNPFTQYRQSVLKHWSETETFDSERGDIKFIWETARFGWAYTLARAYAATGNDKYAQTFWILWESFIAANPPQIGPNWKCGQEISIRSLACIFALYVFWNSPCTTVERVKKMSVFLAASAERIYKNINYARSTKSNHGIGEAIGLYTIGVLFPEFKEAGRWKKNALDILNYDAMHKNATDGSYIQHSMNYHRFMLQVYLWVFLLADINGESFPEKIKSRIKSSVDFLYQMQDPATGRVPNYGSNDGSLIVPLNNCDYSDYKPVIGALHYYFNKKLLYENGLWQEDIFWLWDLNSIAAPRASIEKKSTSFNDGGYFVLRGRDSWAMVRCHTYKTRPAHADMLHFDLWWKGLNILHDSGSYLYFDKDGWHLPFSLTAAHNTVMVSDKEQMVKGPHFMWLSLPRARFIGSFVKDGVEFWQGEHYAYSDLPSHITCRRNVCRADDNLWIVVDDILGKGQEKASLYWNLPDIRYSLEGNLINLHTPEGQVLIAVHCFYGDVPARVVKGQQENKRLGWNSLYYGQKTASPVFSLSAFGRLPVRFVTFIFPGENGGIEESGPGCVKFIARGKNSTLQVQCNSTSVGNNLGLSIKSGNVVTEL